MVGFISGKVGKVIAIAAGSGIILLQIAHQQGYVKVNWNKVNKKIDKIADKVEEKLTGEGPTWSDKMERYVDRKLDQAEDALKGQKTKAKKWYSSFIGEGECKMTEMHIFLLSFVAGVSIGVATS